MDFCSAQEMMQRLNNDNFNGLYFIRARSEEAIQKMSNELYSEWLTREKPSLDPLLVYIGKANGNDGLKQRLEQELYHKGAGTFFRSLGAVMGKRTIIAHTPAGIRNYRFENPAKEEIIDFIVSDLEVAVIHMDDVGSILTMESTLIETNKPIFNIKGNPNPSQVIFQAREQCRMFAAGIFTADNCSDN